jgi:hypothetical protein
MCNKYRLAQLVIVFSIIGSIVLAQDVTEMTFRNNRDMYTYNSNFFLQKDTLYGVLLDNGVSNYVETSQYEKGEFLFARIPVHKKITDESGLKEYVFFLDKLKEGEIYSKKYKEIEGCDKEVSKAIKKSMKLVGKLIKKTDINIYKETELYKKRAQFYPEIMNLDLNEIDNTKVQDLVCLDYRGGFFLIHCYNRTLCYSKSHHGEYLSFYAIYNNNEQKVESVFVTITGFFLE